MCLSRFEYIDWFVEPPGARHAHLRRYRGLSGCSAVVSGLVAKEFGLATALWVWEVRKKRKSSRAGKLGEQHRKLYYFRFPPSKRIWPATLVPRIAVHSQLLDFHKKPPIMPAFTFPSTSISLLPVNHRQPDLRDKSWICHNCGRRTCALDSRQCVGCGHAYCRGCEKASGGGGSFIVRS
ncbi:hypothetical protein BKA81DRAFT_109228 [Phyllosticta paracitricarpa]